MIDGCNFPPHTTSTYKHISSYLIIRVYVATTIVKLTNYKVQGSWLCRYVQQVGKQRFFYSLTIANWLS